ncbi:MAG TPA: hypothetical protein VMH24_06515, partial [Candidatus Sulfotelmatobacter sp.]|nr:hypothetical protein [Candidatus Sulfotelmatobacter sp.]
AAARAAGSVVGLAVGVQARSMPLPEIEATADVILGGPPEAARFLAGLARAAGPAAEPTAGRPRRPGPSGSRGPG